LLRRERQLSIDLLDKLEDAYLDARSHDRKIRTQFLAASWDWIRNEKGVEKLPPMSSKKRFGKIVVLRMPRRLRF
jgi:hypothetical protein